MTRGPHRRSTSCLNPQRRSTGAGSHDCQQRHRNPGSMNHFPDIGKMPSRDHVVGVNKMVGCALQSQRDCIHQPKVGAQRLPWVNRKNGFQPQRGCILPVPVGCNPFRVGNVWSTNTQGSSFLATLGWMTESLWDSPAGARLLPLGEGPGMRVCSLNKPSPATWRRFWRRDDGCHRTSNAAWRRDSLWKRQGNQAGWGRLLSGLRLERNHRRLRRVSL